MMINNEKVKNVWEKGKFHCAFYRKGVGSNSINVSLESVWCARCIKVLEVDSSRIINLHVQLL